MKFLSPTAPDLRITLYITIKANLRLIIVIRYITIIYHVNYQYPIGSHRTDNRMKSRTLVSRVQPACSQRAASVQPWSVREHRMHKPEHPGQRRLVL